VDTGSFKCAAVGSVVKCDLAVSVSSRNHGEPCLEDALFVMFFSLCVVESDGVFLFSCCCGVFLCAQLFPRVWGGCWFAVFVWFWGCCLVVQVATSSLHPALRHRAEASALQFFPIPPL
jgi:hypothetical protein